MVEFVKWDEENDTIIKSKVNTSTIDEFKEDMESFVNRMKKYAQICFLLPWLQDQEYSAVWIYIDFCTS